MFPYTKQELTALQRSRLMELIKEAGGVAALAKLLGIPASTAQGWSDRGRISKEGAKKLSFVQSTSIKQKFTPEYVRPDINL